MAFFSRRPAARPAKPVYAFCERVTASPISPLHIRELTAVGMKRGGGADTLALCGANVAWDTSTVELADIEQIIARDHSRFRVCTACAAAVPALVDP